MLAFLIFKAYDYYQIAVDQGIFPSTIQRSIYNEKNLRAQPWWTLSETGYEAELKVYEIPSNFFFH